MSTKPTDDIDAFRMIAEVLKDFKPDDQQRILRWSSEKLGLQQSFAGPGAPPVQQPGAEQHHAAVATSPYAEQGGGGGQDIKSFITTKNPRNDVQFAATVAYYLQFEAPSSERKSSINKEDLKEACRKVGRVGRERLKNPGQTLRNAHTLGLLDKSGEPGHFSVNTVGENLVAMTLPSDGTSKGKPNRRTKPKVSRGSKKTPGTRTNKA